MDDEVPHVTFGPGAIERMIDLFEWTIDEEGWIVDEDGERVESFNGHELTIDEIGGVVKDEDGEPVPLRDNFSDVFEYVEQTHDDT